jgi:SOS-response transcriptional repressor LexA
MHIIQTKILQLSKSEDLGKLTLRAIAYKIGEKDSSPQKIKHHIEQLIKKGFAIYKISTNKASDFISIPLLGTADCGDASVFAEQNFEGFVVVSKNFPLKGGNIKNLFAIKADGESMNKAVVPNTNKRIENGDFVIVDKTQTDPKNNDIVLAILDNNATIKRYVDDRVENNQIILMPESTKFFSPIYIHESDNFSINGKVVDVIKKPNLKK